MKSRMALLAEQYAETDRRDSTQHPSHERIVEMQLIDPPHDRKLGGSGDFVKRDLPGEATQHCRARYRLDSAAFQQLGNRRIVHDCAGGKDRG